MVYFAQIFTALDYLHRSKVLHRDLKTSNIFICKNGTLKLGDFGIAKILDNSIQNANTVVGTPYYMSPEICKNNPYSFKSDLWSLGCIVYEMCELRRPFESSNLLGLVSEITEKNYKPISSNYSKSLHDLISLILIKDPSQRPSLEELKNHEFFKNSLNELNKTELKNSQKNPFGKVFENQNEQFDVKNAKNMSDLSKELSLKTNQTLNCPNKEKKDVFSQKDENRFLKPKEKNEKNLLSQTNERERENFDKTFETQVFQQNSRLVDQKVAHDSEEELEM